MSNRDYYENCAVPKPKDKKKKKATNGWKEKPNRVCVICGKRGAERHELFGASNRQISILNRFQIDLCREHHEEFHQNSKSEMVLAYRQKAQREWEEGMKRAGATDKQARSAWLEMIGRNYL